MGRTERDAKPILKGGTIQGKKATAPELQWAKALEKAQIPYIFQFEVPTSYSLPGRGKMVDFIVDGKWADEIDGEIAHKGISQRAQDQQRDILLSDNLHALGVNDIRRIDAERFTDDNYIQDLVRQYYR
jgi:hypothetical protein